MPQGNYLQNLSLLRNASIPIFSTKKSKWLNVGTVLQLFETMSQSCVALKIGVANSLV